MTAHEEQISRIDNELNGARRDLRDTMTAVNAKVEHAEDELRPDRLVERYPVGATCLAGPLGFLVGSNTNNPSPRPAMFLPLLRYPQPKASSKNCTSARSDAPP